MLSAGPSMAVFGRKLTKSVTELGESEGELGQWISDQPLNPLGLIWWRHANIRSQLEAEG